MYVSNIYIRNDFLFWQYILFNRILYLQQIDEIHKTYFLFSAFYVLQCFYYYQCVFNNYMHLIFMFTMFRSSTMNFDVIVSVDSNKYHLYYYHWNLKKIIYFILIKIIIYNVPKFNYELWCYRFGRFK